jgi:hypothetical protein
MDGTQLSDLWYASSVNGIQANATSGIKEGQISREGKSFIMPIIFF